MKTALLILLLSCSGLKLSSTDISTDQYYELITDVNHNGWPDAGDEIQYFVKINSYAKETQHLDLHTTLPNYLDLDAEFIQQANGQIDLVHAGFNVMGLKIHPPYGQQEVSFTALVSKDLPSTHSTLTIKTDVHTDGQIHAAKDVTIHLKPTSAAVHPSKAGFASTAWMMISLALGIICGSALLQRKWLNKLIKKASVSA